MARYALSRPFALMVVVGMKRSGNHVFINWLRCQSPGPSLHWNDIGPAMFPTRQFRREMRLNAPFARPTVTFSYEDTDPDTVFGRPLSDFVKVHQHRIAARSLCLVLRDPKNMMASRFKKWPEAYQNPDRGDEAARLWQNLARQALELRRPRPDFEMVPVYYNVFVTSRTYRAGLSRKLGIRDGDRGLDEVPNFGHGSSFDGMSADGDPRRMDLFNRWRGYEDDPLFMRLFEDGTMQALDCRLADQAGIRGQGGAPVQANSSGSGI